MINSFTIIIIDDYVSEDFIWFHLVQSQWLTIQLTNFVTNWPARGVIARRMEEVGWEVFAGERGREEYNIMKTYSWL